MSKILQLIAVCLAVFMNVATASNVRTRAGGTTRGDIKGRKPSRRTTNAAHSPRLLKGHYNGYHEYSYYPVGHGKGNSKSKGKGGMMGGKSKSGRYPGRKMNVPKCRPVVEGAEFIIEGALSATMANMTEDAGTIGTEFIYNGPLLEFNQNDELQELENFFLSGSCVRTQERNGDMPGAGHCSFTATLDTGATMNFAGEAFDGWDNLMAIDGGSQELIGLSGTVTLIGLNDNFEDTDDDFFSVPWIYGEAVLVYSICPQGYWERYYIQDHDALPPPSIPNPFAQPEPEPEHYYVVEPAPHPYPADDDGADDDDGYDYNY